MVKIITTIMFVTVFFVAKESPAKTIECPLKPSYDIFVYQDRVQVHNKLNDLTMYQDGKINFNAQTMKVTREQQTKINKFNQYLRTQLPEFEKIAHSQLTDVRDVFELAIKEKLGNNSELLKSLNKLYNRLSQLLTKAIITENSVTSFYHKPFNNLKKEGTEIGNKVFYGIVGKSILKFSVIKNYSAIKKIAKQEWKQQKVTLKLFDQQVCELVSEIDNQYKPIISELTVLQQTLQETGN